MNLNLVQVCGRITRKPEVKTLQSGTLLASFSVATNKKWKDSFGQKKEQVEFHNMTAFGKTAEAIATYFDKGDEIYVQGSLQTQNWDKDGVKHYKTVILVDKFEFGQKSGKNTEPAQENSLVDNSQPTEPEPNPEDIPF